MRGLALLVVGAGLTAALTGCNQPAVALKPPAFQESANTIRDWDVVAQKIADRISVQRDATGLGYLHGPFFIYSTAPRSTFLHEVAEQLKLDLLRHGFAVSTTPVDATVINLKVNVVKWGPRDKPPGGLGTLAGAVGAAGVVAGASAPYTTWQAARAGAWGAGAAGVLTDLAVAITPTMNAEATWEASIVAGDYVLMSMREPLYIRDHDLALYYGGIETAELTGPAYRLYPRRVRLDP